ISRYSHIALTLRRKTLNEIDVIHSPSFAKASEGILLRAMNMPDPAKRVTRSRMIKGSEIRKPDYPIEAILLDRGSPRAMSGEELCRSRRIHFAEVFRAP